MSHPRNGLRPPPLDAAEPRGCEPTCIEPITDLDALALSRAIHTREISCVEVMQAYLARIHRLNPRFTAIVSLADDDALLALARERDAELAKGASRGWMHGLPQAIKDASPAAGLPYTFGSPLLKDAIARNDSIMVERMRTAGCIVIGKTNVPEFGMGSHTYNKVFGTTRNAWDLGVSAGGSSGGAAVALAQRLLPVADGSDVMGSLRNPAGWNHVFGLRPSQGRVPYGPATDVWIRQLPSEGPMARTVRDLAQLLSTQAGYDPRAPLSLAQGPQSFVPGSDASVRGLRIAWLGDLGGHLATEPGVLDVCAHALQVLERGGAAVEPLDSIGIDLERVWQAWQYWRWALQASLVGAVMTTPAARAQVKPEAQWEYDQAQSLSASDLIKASEVRTRLYTALLQLFERFDALALPVAQVWPFPLEQHWPQRIAGRPMDTYHRWMEATIYATFAGLPAISVPAGFHANGRWPMGLQLIGRPHGDAALLALAAGYEALIPELLARRPPEPIPG